MAFAINIIDECEGSALLVTVKEEKGNAVFAVQFAIKAL